MLNRDWNRDERGPRSERKREKMMLQVGPQKVAASAATTHGPQAYGLPIEFTPPPHT